MSPQQRDAIDAALRAEPFGLSQGTAGPGLGGGNRGRGYGLPCTSARSVIGKALACAVRADLHRRRVRGQVARTCCQGTRGKVSHGPFGQK